MVLDPLSAFAVACNVLQIVETSITVLGKAAESYKNGAPDEVSILIGNLNTIESLAGDLRKCTPDLSGSTPLSSAERRLAEANEECLRLAGDFTQTLDGLTASRKSVLHSIGKGIKTAWNQDRLAGFEKAVSERRANLTLALLLLMLERSSTAQRSVVKATTDSEDRILDAVKGTTGSLEAEMRKLISRLGEMSLETRKTPTDEFSLVNQKQLLQALEQVAKILEQQRASGQATQSLETSRAVLAAQQRLLHSLQSPQLQERREQISSAHEKTCEWLFRTDSGGQDDWHNFVDWTREAANFHNIYWIHGKPGSGKSTLSRLIYDRLNIDDHLRPWAGSGTVFKAAHFFWNPGATLQKSWTGMLRSLFSQLLDQAPELSKRCVSHSRWRGALYAESGFVEWNDSELIHGIQIFVREAQAHLLFLIDGLDELEGGEERHEQLADFISDLGSYDNVKICVSSRPYNVFRDAFHECPGLKLDTLTYKDIQTFVKERFAKERRIRLLTRSDPEVMHELVEFLVDAASGVFLWVRLVVEELRRAARDGATLPELVKRAHQLPRDLDSYFTRFIDSIPPEYRREASQLFQIMLHDERSFRTDPGLRLLDLSYIGHFQDAARTSSEPAVATFDPEDVAELEVRLDATARRVNSRCRGLIECYERGEEDKWALIDYPDSEDELGKSMLHGGKAHGLLRAYNRHAGLIHRSLRDFLISPMILQRLEAYSKGPFNTRLFLCKARLAQIWSFDHEGNHMNAQIVLGLSNYILCAIGTDDLKRSDESVLIATQIRPIVESLGPKVYAKDHYSSLDLCTSFYASRTDFPDFLGVAIDFDLQAYLEKELTPQSIRAKRGLSVLNCILIGRFPGDRFEMGNRFPNIEVLRLALELGADPNAGPNHCSAWAEFIEHICISVKRTRKAPPVDAQKPQAEAIRALLEYGADPELPSACLTPGPLLPHWKTDEVPVSLFLSGMLVLYTHARQELRECIELADEKLMQEYLNIERDIPP